VEIAAAAGQFRAFADQVVARLPLYRRLCEEAAGDFDVASRILLGSADQQTPNLLLAAVHDVLLAGEVDPLADWYPSCTARPRPVGLGADDPWPHFRRLALYHPRVARLLETASTQTNEVGRSAAIYPALFAVGRSQPLGIVEVGASAGLNLHPGRYGYRYRIPSKDSMPEQVITSATAGSMLMIDCELRGDLVPPLPEDSLPIASTVGIDQHPLDLAHAPDARWLVACQWPEERDRIARLRAAIALAQGDPPVVEPGDAVTALGHHVAAVAAHTLPVVVATWVLAYLPVERQQRFMQELATIGAQRDVALLFAEQPERISGIAVPPRPDGRPDGRATALVVMVWRDGECTEVRLADLHPHGRWLEWLQR